MSGSCVAINSARSSFTTTFTVTVDDLGIFGIGFATGVGGSISPTDFRGVAMRGVLSPSIAGGNVAIGILGNQRQDFFTRLRIQNKTGGLVDLFTPAATFLFDGTNSNWSWTSAGEIWDFTTVGLNRSAALTFAP